MVDRLKVACFSGHRKLPPNCDELKQRLKETIEELIYKGVIYFGVGGAIGFDLLTETTILELKEQFPYIRLILVLPCPPEQQTLKWNNEQRRTYYDILSKADKVRILSEKYTKSCMLDRNRHLVNNSGYLVCYLRENKGGTFYTVNYAATQNISIIRL